MSLISSVTKLAATSGLMLSLALSSSLLHAQTQTAAPDADHRVDNSAQNKGQHSTADKQPNNQSDLQTTRQIRKAIIADKSLSTYGHNIKIITLDGAVTLKGPVHSDQEKQALVTDAEGVAGAGKVTDQITVKGSSRHNKKSE